MLKRIICLCQELILFKEQKKICEFRLPFKFKSSLSVVVI